LNQLKYFHVAAPGLPPCIAHDLYEGVVQYNLMLVVNYFVSKKTITYDYLNLKLQSVRFRNEAYEKVPSIKKGEKLPGSATENIRLLQIFPLAIYDLVDTSDPVWKMLLILRKISSFVMSFKISIGQVAHLRSLLFEYINLRITLFPNVKIRPKHHYILHYPDLILKFGPLRPLWTLRFESKHRYFKNIVRHSPNYKNILFSFSEKHQLLQALLLSQDSTFNDNVICESVTIFSPDGFPEYVSSVIKKECTFKQSFIGEKVKFRGTEYKKGMFVCYGINENGHYRLCEVTHIMIDTLYQDIFFVGTKLEIIEYSDIGVFVILKKFNYKEITCLHFSSITPHEPLQQFLTPSGSIFFNFKSSPFVEL
jgi:hypothetical protein